MDECCLSPNRSPVRAVASERGAGSYTDVAALVATSLPGVPDRAGHYDRVDDHAIDGG